MPEEMKQKKRLNENLGHTLPQVIMGALLGTVIGPGRADPPLMDHASERTGEM